MRDDVGRLVSLERVGAHRHPELPHHARRLEPVAGDVADHEPDLPAGERDHVVPVAARLEPHLGGQVPSGEREPVDRREVLGEQCALERLGDPVLAVVVDAFGDVLDDAEHPDGGARLVEEQTGASEQRSELAVGADDPILDLGQLALPHGERGRQVAFDPLAVLLGHQLDRLLERHRERPGLVPVDPVQVVGPRDRPGPQIPLPAAQTREVLRLRELVLARAAAWSRRRGVR